MSGGETAEPIANWYIQNWEDVGIKVQLTDGRLHEFNSFYVMVEADDPKIDIYQGAWGTGPDPDPSGLYVKMQHITTRVTQAIKTQSFLRQVLLKRHSY